ncbi:TetR/AcrR family transcriptional regulator C-terminal domain-containing protein [Streptomyces decoyicus]|uniref:TetR/AcrR family transcriptional regulator C-terminal domain-containing protein n=1 Tax=Streptomyces decoyicus TaxID=249567 RepID=UPI0038005C41
MPTRPPLGPHLMRRTEFLLQVLVRQGLTVGEAMTYAALLDRHLPRQRTAGGGGARHVPSARAPLPQQLSEAITAARDLAVEGGRHPLLTEWMTAPSGAGMDEQSERSLAFLLDGIATRLPGGEEGATP